MRRKVLIMTAFAACSSVLHGCIGYHGKQEDWHTSVDRGYSAVAYITRPGTPLLVDEQLISLIGLEPDFKLNPLEFHTLLGLDKSYRKRIMELVWHGYSYSKRDAGQLDWDPHRDKWEDCEQFKKCSFWIYDESLHFAKPLGHGDLLYCLFCAEPAFLSYVFFVENEKVTGSVPLKLNQSTRASLKNQSEK